MRSILIFALIHLLFFESSEIVANPSIFRADPISHPAYWRSYNQADGLPTDDVYVICETQNKKIWFAGKRTVSTFNGSEFTTYDSTYFANTSVIGNAASILHTKDKAIWIGSEKGILNIKNTKDIKNTWHFFSSQKYPIPNGIAKALCETQDGKIWVGFGTNHWISETPQGGLASWDGQKWHIYQQEQLRQYINAIYEDDTGQLWIGTDQGILRFDPQNNTLKHYVTQNGFTNTQILSIYQSQDGAMWFGTDKGLSKFTQANNQWHNYPINALTNNDTRKGVVSIHQTTDNTLWALIWGAGLYRYQQDNWKKCNIYPVDYSGKPLSEYLQGSLEYNKMYCSKSDVFWLPGKQLVRFDYSGQQWNSFHHVSGPPFEDPQGGLWFNTAYKQANNWRQEGTIVFNQNHPTIIPEINWPIYRSADGKLWSGGSKAQFLNTNNPTLTAYPKENIHSKVVDNFKTYYPTRLDSLGYIFQSQNHHIWFIGTQNNHPSILQFDGQNWHIHQQQSWSIFRSGLKKMVESPQQGLWVLPYGGPKLEGFGLLYYDYKNSQWTHHMPEASQDIEAPKPTNLAGRIYDLVVDTDQKVWLATFKGVWSFDPNRKTWKHINAQHSPQNLKTVQLYISKDGALWVAAANEKAGHGGVFRYKNNQWTSYHESDGLAQNDVWAIHESNNNIMWFGTTKGISRFDGQNWLTYKQQDGLFSDDVRYIFESTNGTMWFGKAHNYAPRERWTTVYTPNRIPPKTKLTFMPENFYQPSGDIFLSWEGKDPWQNTPTKMLLYSWKLDAENWSPYSQKLDKSFFNLPPQKHLFSVRAMDLDGNVDPTPAQFSFYVLPPVWQQPWFLTLMATLLSAISYLSFRVIKRGQDLSTSNSALSDANKQLFQVNQTLTAEIAERERLDTQIQDLQFLYTLRATLGEKRTPNEVMEAVGNAIINVLGPEGSIVLTLDDHTFAVGKQNAQHTYNRTLSWGERKRGTLQVFSPITLSESQERTLLDETAGQLTRVLESRELQMQLLQSARLVSLGQMAAGVAHELNQPLGGISATAEDYYLRLQENMSVSSEQIAETFKRILGMVDRMSNTVEHLRIFSRDTSQEPGKPLNLNEVIQSSLDIIGTQLKNHSIDVKLELAPELSQMIGHPYQVEQIFLNLLGNARDALDAQSASNTIFKTITISTRQNANTIIATIQDNGTGIDPEHLNRIFEPFYTTKPADKGTGLGLSITYAIVKNHGGNITCTSTKDKGTTFEVTFPISQPNT